MVKPEGEQIKQAVERLWEFCVGLAQSTSPLRWLGYGFVLLFFLDVATVLIPPQFLNPLWEFQVQGQLVERAVVPLLGFGLLALGSPRDRSGWEQIMLRIVPWIMLLVGIFYLLMVPLGAVNSVRLYRIYNSQINNQLTQRTTQIQEFQKQLKGVSSASELEALVTKATGTQANLKTDFQTAKEELSSTLAQGEKKLSKDAEKVRADQRLNLVKNSIKWNLGALISGVLFIAIWRSVWKATSVLEAD